MNQENEESTASGKGMASSSDADALNTRMEMYRPFLLTEATPSEDLPPFNKRKAREEWVLLKRHGLTMLVMMAYLFYGPLMVFRNVAFYRFEAGPRLKDLGYELIAESGDDSVVAFLNLFPMNIVVLAYLSMCIATFFVLPTTTENSSNDEENLSMSNRSSDNNTTATATATLNGGTADSATQQDTVVTIPNDLQESNAPTTIPKSSLPPNKPYVVNMLRRAMIMLLVGHTLRFFTYSVTSLPGTARHCLPGGVEHTHPGQPRNAHDIFTRYALSPGQNCGDLVFSGHILQIMTPVLSFRMYSAAAFSTILHATTAKRIEYFLWFLVVTQGFFIISLRNHYTSDVVVGAYITPLLWHFGNGLLFPIDDIV